MNPFHFLALPQWCYSVLLRMTHCSPTCCHLNIMNGPFDVVLIAWWSVWQSEKDMVQCTANKELRVCTASCSHVTVTCSARHLVSGSTAQLCKWYSVSGGESTHSPCSAVQCVTSLLTLIMLSWLPSMSAWGPLKFTKVSFNQGLQSIVQWMWSQGQC